jgi:nucleotide-binding universal stress UspA family protein
MAIQHSLSPLVRSHRPLATVLIGTSLGEESDPVVRAGLAVARAAGARVILAHAAQLEPMVGYEVGAGPDLEREQIARCQEGLREQIARLGIEERELAGSTVRVGAPYRILTEASRQAGADLIVVGATAAGWLASGVLGSTAERVVRKAACPVLVVRDGLRMPPRSVLVPVDLSTLSADSFHCGLHLLAQLAGSGESEVRALYASVSQPLSTGTASDALPAAGELRRFILENRPETPFKVETAVRSGEARTAILQELEEHPADLVIVGTHGRGGLDRLIIGSVAATLARKAPCSVLVISPEAALGAGNIEANIETKTEAVTARTAPALRREPSRAA